MDNLLKERYNLTKLTEAEASLIFGGKKGTLADEIGYAIGKAARWIKDLGDDDKWFG